MYRMIRSDIYFNDAGELDIDYEHQNHNGISTVPGRGSKQSNDAFGRDPYLTADSLLNGHEVFSVYGFKTTNHVEIFKAIKRGEWDVESYQEWIDFTARYIYQKIIRPNPCDVIAIPESSSNFVLDVAKAISKYARVPYLPHAFKKNPASAITLSVAQGDPGYESAKKVLDRIKQNGKFEAKLVPKRMLKFFRNIYTNDAQYLDVLEGKRVAVVDDSMTSKSTMMNIFDVCDYIYNVESAYGVTVFKRSGSSKRSSSTEE